VQLWLAATVVLAVTFVFSMLGMGGGQLIIPALFWLGLDFKTEAIPIGLLCGAISATSASVTYVRHRVVNWRVGGPFMVAVLVGPPLGAFVSVHLPPGPVIVCFALFSAAAGLLMLTGWRPHGRELSRPAQWLIGAIGGLALGFVTGLLGRGGGSFVVPLLYLCGLEPRAAAATSAVIVTGSNWMGFLSHLAVAHLSPGLLVACGAAGLIGSQAGSNLMATRLKSHHVKIVFGSVLLAVAAILIVKDVLLAG